MKNRSRQRTSTPPATHSLYQKTTLPNALRVVTEHIPNIRSVSIGVWVDVGSRDETEATNGITHFIEHMVFKGTTRRSLREISRSIESVGGYMNAFTSKEHTCFYARVLDDHTRLALDVLSDLTLNAVFPERELEKEKGVVIEELRNAEDDPDDIIHDYLEKALYGRHPMGFPVIGREDNLRRFQKADLLAHRKHHYVASRMVVTAAGNVNHEEIVEWTERLFAGVSKSGNQAQRRKPDGRRAERVEVEKPIQQAHVALGTRTFSIKSRQRYPLLVLNTLLGDGMSSRLFQNIRERHGFAYSVYSFASLLSDTGVFGIYVGTDKAHVGACEDLVLKELDKLKTRPVSRAELLRTKEQLKGSMMLSLENIPSRMMRLGTSELYFQGYSPLDEIIQEIDRVTADDLQSLSAALFREEQFARVLFLPTSSKESSARSIALAAKKDVNHGT